jgi:hypothetical protein
MFPAERRDMWQQVEGDLASGGGKPAHGFAQFQRVPVDDCGGEEVHARDAVMLAFTGPVADFTAPVKTHRPFQRVVGFALIEPGLGAAPKVRVQDLLDHERGAFNAASFTERHGEFVLAGI